MAAAFCIVGRVCWRVPGPENWAQNQGCRRPLAPGKRTLQGSRTRAFRARFANSKAALERPARNRGFPASELLFSPRQAPILHRRVSERARVRVPGDSYLPDGECSVKSIWGTRTRLAASPSRDKILCRCSPTAVTAALQGTPWRGDTPRRGLSASSCSDWDGPHLASLNHGCAERGVASLLGSGAPVVLSDCWTDMTEIRQDG